jgi:hypothetical protein
MLKHQKALRNWLATAHLEAMHYWVLEELRLASWPRSSIIRRATDGSQSLEGGWEIDERDADDAISDLIARGLAQEVIPESLERITNILQSPSEVRASSLLLPEVGEIAFTLKGARLVVALYNDIFRMYPSSHYVIDEKEGRRCSIYGISEDAIAQALWEHRQEVPGIKCVGSRYPIDHWRSDWWYLHQSGVAIDIIANEFQGHHS